MLPWRGATRWLEVGMGAFEQWGEVERREACCWMDVASMGAFLEERNLVWEFLLKSLDDFLPGSSK